MPFVSERRSVRAHLWLPRVFAFGVCALVLVGLTIPESTFAQGGAANTFANYLLFALASILEWVLNTAGTLVLLFVDMIISVAQYNDFVNALPVKTGWPLVRDVVNMFFIVILLVTAFSTIIQYQKFQYRKVLPKLLLMAVLVNFSKTFIGLLIDLSQVIMLTFVNGFQAAAAGNFVSALKLNQVLQLATDRGFSTRAENQLNVDLRDSFLLRIVMAEMLGVFLLGISLITLILMLLYLVFRVVGLWIALIMSPAAFFASALDSTPLSKGVAFIAGNFWPRLGALLTGGPIMAFFLWLTLATVQTGGFGDFTKVGGAAARQAEQGEAISYFATTVGNAQEVATFFVAIMMLLLGLEAAMSIASQVSPALGKAGERVRAAGMAATRFAAYRGVAMGGAFAGRTTGRVGRAGARFIDSRFDVSGKVGGLIQKTGQVIPTALGGAVVGAALARAGGKLRGAGGERRKEFEKEFESTLANMDPGEEIARLKKLATSANLNKRKAAQNRLGKLMTSKPGTKALKDQYKKAGEGRGLEGAELDAYVENQTQEDIQKQFADFSKLAEDTGDKEMLEKRDETLEKRPDYLVDTEEKSAFSDYFQKNVIDKGPAVAARTISPDAWKNSRMMDSLIAKTDILDERTGEWNKDSEWYKRIIRPGGTRKEAFEAHRQALLARAGAAGPQGMKEAASQMKPEMLYVQQEGKWTAFNKEKLSNPPGKNRGKAKRRRHDLVKLSNQQTERLRKDLDKGSDAQKAVRVDQMRQSQLASISQGGTVAEVYQFDKKKGEFSRPEDRANFEQNTKDFIKQARNDHRMYQSLDVADLYANPNGRNDARTDFASSANVGQIGEAWDAAAEGRNQESMEQLQLVAGAIHLEGKQVENKIADWNRKHTDKQVDMVQVIRAGDANDQGALDAAVQGMTDTEKISLKQARALAHKEVVNKLDLGHYMEKEMSKHAQEAYNRSVERRAARGGPSPSTP